MLRTRIIPTLLIDEGALVKTRRFKSPIYLGDPINAIKIFNEKGVDEMCVMDIGASRRGTEPDYALIRKMASEAFMPLSYGGGVKTIDQMRSIFRDGFEKIIINSAFTEDEELVRNAVSVFGRQSIVCAIDYKKDFFGVHCYVYGGSKKCKWTPDEMAQRAETCGAGELLLYSMDRDGMRTGYDVETIRCVAEKTKIPVIACGGADSMKDMKDVLNAGASAAAAGSMFSFWGKKQAVLIHYPAEEEWMKNGIIK